MVPKFTDFNEFDLSTVESVSIRSDLEYIGDKAAISIPVRVQEAVTWPIELDADVKGAMTSALFPEMIRPIVTLYRDSQFDAALAQWQECLSLINHENGQCGLRACKAVFTKVGVIGSDRARQPLWPLSERTCERSLSLAGELDIVVLYRDNKTAFICMPRNTES